MLSRSALAQLIDGTSVDCEVDRLCKKGGSWVDAAAILSRRINWTLDWAELGSTDARYKVVGSRGEAVLFWDSQSRNRIMKLRGREENGFGGAGFGCILSRDKMRRVSYAPGSMLQAIKREELSWQHLGFACGIEDVIEDEAGMLLTQQYIVGGAPTEKEIHSYMTGNGWASLNGHREVSPTLQADAWRKGNVAAFDANETNFIKAEADGKIYPIDLIVWHWPK